MKYRRKRRDSAEAELEKLKRQLLADDALKDHKIVFRSSQEKMSEVLLEFMEPYQKYATTPTAYEKLVALAVVAWNAALLEETERQNLLDKPIETILAMAGKEWENDLVNILMALIQRKERYFADNKRLIFSYHVSQTKEGYHLSVASTAESTSIGQGLAQ